MRWKVCTACEQRKGENSFRRDGNGLSDRCSDCLSTRRNRTMATRRRQARLWVLAYQADHPCIDCGEQDPRVLQFDHRDPAQKRASVAVLIAKGASLRRLQDEIALCDVRCANCHARRTSDQRGFYTSDPEYVGD